MVTILTENIKPLISGLELISCPLQLIHSPDVMERSGHIGEVLTASSEAPVTLVTPTSQQEILCSFCHSLFGLYIFFKLKSFKDTVF